MEPWIVGLTAAIAFFAAASMLSSGLFYWWTWKQRNPKPILTWASIHRQDEDEYDRACLMVVLGFTNPGEVPIHVVSVSAMPRGIPGVDSVGYRPRQVADTIPPHGAATIEEKIWLEGVDEEEAFPLGETRAFEVSIRYVSGGRQMDGSFGELVGVTRHSEGGWSTEPLIAYYRRTTTPR